MKTRRRRKWMPKYNARSCGIVMRSIDKMGVRHMTESLTLIMSFISGMEIDFCFGHIPDIRTHSRVLFITNKKKTSNCECSRDLRIFKLLNWRDRSISDSTKRKRSTNYYISVKYGSLKFQTRANASICNVQYSVQMYVVNSICKSLDLTSSWKIEYTFEK